MTNNWIIPDVQKEIDEIKKFRAISDIDSEKEKLFDKGFNPNYVLIDAALWGKEIENIFIKNVNYRSLFRGTAGEKLWSVAPYLVELNSCNEIIKYIEEKDPVSRRVTWIHSQSGIDGLRRHFRRFLRMKTQKGLFIYFRFYDPYVVNCVIPNLTPIQTEEFFSEIDYIVTEDVRINERRIFYLSAKKELKIKYEQILCG